MLYLPVVSGYETSGFYSDKMVVLGKYRNIREDTAKINELTATGIRYLSSPGQAEKAKGCIDSALILCEKGNVEIPSLLHLLIAEYNYFTGDLGDAFEEAELALKGSSDRNEYKVQARTRIFLGKYYWRTGLFKESIECFEDAISISRKNGLKRLIPVCYQGQASVYEKLGDLKSMRKNFILMINAGLNEKDSSSATRGYYLLGTSYCGDSAISVRRNFIKADSLLRESIRISVIRNDTSMISMSYANTGWNYYLEKMYDSALINYNRSLRYNQPGKYAFASTNSLGNIGTIYRDLGEYEKSLKYYNKAIDQGKKRDDVENLRWIYGDMSDLYLILKDTSKAFRAYVNFKKYSDRWLIKSSSQGLTDAMIRYEAETHRKEVELLSLKLKNNRLLIYGFAGLAILTVIIAFLLYRGMKLKNRRRISEMNQKISEITQANLRQQMNPHFIFNTLNSIQYYMYQHDKLATNNYLTKFSNLMRKVLDNSQHTSVPLSDELSALKLYLELESIRFRDKFDFEINVDEEIDPLMYKVPTMLIQPYVENSICHGLMPLEEKGIVKIDLGLKDSFILCTIEDNGVGREAARERNLKRDNNHNSLGTKITKSRLELVNELYGTTLKTEYTDLKDENGDPAGTRVEIQIPILT